MCYYYNFIFVAVAHLHEVGILGGILLQVQLLQLSTGHASKKSVEDVKVSFIVQLQKIINAHVIPDNSWHYWCTTVATLKLGLLGTAGLSLVP